MYLFVSLIVFDLSTFPHFYFLVSDHTYSVSIPLFHIANLADLFLCACPMVFALARLRGIWERESLHKSRDAEALR